MKRLYHLCLSLVGKHWQIFSYLVFGVLTTVVNYIVYFGCARGAGLSTSTSTIVSWVVAVLFAYLTNRTWVFASKTRGFGPICREFWTFVAARLFSGVMDWGIMVMSVDYWGWDDRIMKLAANILVIVVNYIFSKFFIFRKKDDKMEEKS